MSEVVENFDVLDSNGNKTGEIKSRNNVHKDGDWHRSVYIILINKESQIILQKRSAAKESYPDMWTISASGHLSAGESSEETAVKELEEELGIDVNKEQLEYLFTIQVQEVPTEGFEDNEFSDVYLVEMDVELSNIVVQEEEVSEVKFVHYKEFENMVRTSDPSLIHYDEGHYKVIEILNKRFNRS